MWSHPYFWPFFYTTVSALIIQNNPLTASASLHARDLIIDIVPVTADLTLTGTASVPVGSGLSIVPASNGDIDFFFSDGLREEFGNAYTTYCSPDQNRNCQKHLEDTIASSNLRLQTRKIPIGRTGVAGLFAAYVSWVVATLWELMDPHKYYVPVHITMPAADNRELQAAASATELVVLEGPNAPVITVAPLVAATLTSDEVSISTATASSSDYAPGDLIINISDPGMSVSSVTG